MQVGVSYCQIQRGLGGKEWLRHFTAVTGLRGEKEEWALMLLREVMNEGRRGHDCEKKADDAGGGSSGCGRVLERILRAPGGVQQGFPKGRLLCGCGPVVPAGIIGQ